MSIYLSLLIIVNDKCQTQIQLIHQVNMTVVVQILQVSFITKLIIVKFWFENIADFDIKTINFRSN